MDTVRTVGSGGKRRKNRTGVIRRDIPRTPEHQERSRNSTEFEWFRVQHNKWIIENSKNIVAHYWRDVVYGSLLITLMASTLVLTEHYRPPKSRKTNRKEKWVYHFGVWCKYVKEPRVTSQTKNKYVQAWLKANKRLFEVRLLLLFCLTEFV
jgi:hypothetical protein